MKKRLESLTSEGGVSVGTEVQEEIEEVIEKQTPEIESLPGSDFRRIFWEQQVCAYLDVSSQVWGTYHYYGLLARLCTIHLLCRCLH